MTLHPCPACRRHVASVERACPFCGAAVEAPPARPSLPGRLSRAAVFAGAALAGGCWTGSAQQPTPSDRGSATTPPDRGDSTTRARPADGTGSLRVVILDAQQGTPLGYWALEVTGPGGSRMVRSGADGVAQLADLPPGTYTLVGKPNHPRRSPTRQDVTVVAGQVADVQFHLDLYHQQHHHTPMPYGAPPARSRIV